MARTKKAWKSFEKWFKQEVENEFGLKRHFSFQPLDDLLSNLPELQSDESSLLERFRQKLILLVDSWSEEDLKMNFISGVLNIVDFQQMTYRSFFDYSLTATLKGEPIAGKVDCIVAKGTQIAEKPIFFLQEYKPEKRQASDPLGQLLIAMVASQVLNNDTESPLYGCYIIGRNWFFVVCKGQDYIVSNAFDSTRQEDLETITAILKKIKHLYEVKLNLIPA